MKLLLMLLGIRPRKSQPVEVVRKGGTAIAKKEGRIRGPGIDPVFPELYWRKDGKLTVSAYPCLTPQDYIGAVKFRRRTWYWGGFLTGFFSLAAAQPDPQTHMAGMLSIIACIGCIVSYQRVRSPKVKEKISKRVGKYRGVILGPEEINLAGVGESYDIVRGRRGQLTTRVDVHDQAQENIERIGMDRNIKDTKFAAWEKTVWSQSRTVYANYGGQEAVVAEICDPSLARKLSAGIMAAEEIFQEEMENSQRRGSTWGRKQS